MQNSPVDEIKSRLDIIEVISGYLQLQKAGTNYRARCPFHNEKTPSFMVSPSRQIWHCFGCNAGGDIFGFVMKIENVEFPEALKVLANKAGVILKREDPKLHSEKTRLGEICEAAAKFFEYCLKEKDFGKPVLEYLHKRGLADETIKEFRIGFAPNSWDSLLRFLMSRGYKGPEIEKTGMVIKSEKGTANREYYDRFRSRITFPVANASGQVVGFSGRIFNGREDEAKYVNTPNTLLYDKSKILYGFDKAKNEIRRLDSCFLVEGQMDLIMSWQDGVQNVCATSGTALTSDHLNLLKRCTQDLILGFDMDEAGEHATDRGIDLAMADGFNIKVIALSGGPEGKQASCGAGKDPADFVKEYPGQLKSVLEKGQAIMDYYFERTFQKYDPQSIEEKKKIGVVLLPQIKKIYNKIEQAHWLEELARRLGTPMEFLNQELKKIRSGRLAENEIFQSPAVSQPSGGKMAERLMALVLRRPEHRAHLAGLEAVLPEDFAGLCDSLKAGAEPFAFDDFYRNLPEDTRQQVDYLVLKADYENQLNPDLNFQKEIAGMVRELNRQNVKGGLKRLESEIKEAQEAGDAGLLLSLGKKFHELYVKLTNIK